MAASSMLAREKKPHYFLQLYEKKNTSADAWTIQTIWSKV